MTPKAVEYLLTQDARLLARRDTPVIDQELESQRQAALELFFQWQDGMREFQDDSCTEGLRAFSAGLNILCT